MNSNENKNITDENDNFCYCTQCGKKISKLVAFCPNCNTKVIKQQTSLIDEQQGISKMNGKESVNIKRIVAIVLIIIDGLITMAFIGIFFLLLVVGFVAYFLQGLSAGAQIEHSLILYLFKTLIPLFGTFTPAILFVTISFIWAKKQF